MVNQRKQAERRSLEAAQLSLLNKTIETQSERIKALESLLADTVLDLKEWMFAYGHSPVSEELILRACAILPKTEEVK